MGEYTSVHTAQWIELSSAGASSPSMLGEVGVFSCLFYSVHLSLSLLRRGCPRMSGRFLRLFSLSRRCESFVFLCGRWVATTLYPLREGREVGPHLQCLLAAVGRSHSQFFPRFLKFSRHLHPDEGEGESALPLRTVGRDGLVALWGRNGRAASLSAPPSRPRFALVFSSSTLPSLCLPFFPYSIIILTTPSFHRALSLSPSWAP